MAEQTQSTRGERISYGGKGSDGGPVAHLRDLMLPHVLRTMDDPEFIGTGQSYNLLIPCGEIASAEALQSRLNETLKNNYIVADGYFEVVIDGRKGTYYVEINLYETADGKSPINYDALHAYDAEMTRSYPDQWTQLVKSGGNGLFAREGDKQTESNATRELLEQGHYADVLQAIRVSEDQVLRIEEYLKSRLQQDSGQKQDLQTKVDAIRSYMADWRYTNTVEMLSDKVSNQESLTEGAIEAVVHLTEGLDKVLRDSTLGFDNPVVLRQIRQRPGELLTGHRSTIVQISSWEGESREARRA